MEAQHGTGGFAENDLTKRRGTGGKSGVQLLSFPMSREATASFHQFPTAMHVLHVGIVRYMM